MTISTTALWSATNTALCAGDWAKARDGLEALAGRNDVRDLLCSAKAYGAKGGMADILQARIDAVNRIASR